MKEKLKEFALANWTLSEKALLVTDVLLAGVLIGWLTSPLKRGFSFFSGNAICNKAPDGFTVELSGDEDDDEEEDGGEEA